MKIKQKSMNLKTQATKFLKKLMEMLIKIQNSRESYHSQIDHIVILTIFVLFIVNNSCYTLNLDALPQQPNFYKFNFIFDMLTYLTPDRLAINFGNGTVFLILSMITVVSPIIVTIFQVMHLARSETVSHSLLILFNVTLTISCRILLFSNVSILFMCFKNNYYSQTDPQFKSNYLGMLSALFLIIYALETIFFNNFFVSSSFSERKKNFFSCSNKTGEKIFSISCWVVPFLNTFEKNSIITLNLLKFKFFFICAGYLIKRQPYYNTRTNLWFSYVYGINCANSALFLVAYYNSSRYTLLFFIFFVLPCFVYLINFFFYFSRKELNKVLENSCDENWKIDYITLFYVEEFEKIDSSELSDRWSNQINFLIKQYKSTLKNVRLNKNLVKKGHIMQCLFFIYLKKHELAFYHLFFCKVSVKQHFFDIDTTKIKLILQELDIPQQFCSNYFLFSLKAKKSDLYVCKNLLNLCNQLQENYPKIEKIEKSINFLFQTTKRCFDYYSRLMKSYQNSLILKLYGSFLVDIIKDNSGQRYESLSKTITIESTGYLLCYPILHPDIGFCIFSIEDLNSGHILETSQHFLDYLDLTIDLLPDNISLVIYTPFQKTAQNLLENSITDFKKFKTLEKCFKFLSNYDSLIHDVETSLLPIYWKKQNCIILSVKKSNEILLLLDQNFNFFGISKIFATKILRIKDFSMVNFIIGKNINYFLPNFLTYYRENSEFEYIQSNNRVSMLVKSSVVSINKEKFIILMIGSQNLEVFHYPTILKKNFRRKSLSLINFSDNTAVFFDTTIPVNAESESRKKNNETIIESKRFEYEPPSLSQQNMKEEKIAKVLRGFSRKSTLLKIFIVAFWLLMIVSMAISSTFIGVYFKCYEDYDVLYRFSNLTDSILEISINSRNLHLIHFGIFENTLENEYKSDINNSINDIQNILNYLQNKPISLIYKNNYLFTDPAVNLLYQEGSNLTFFQKNLMDSFQSFILIANQFIQSPNFISDNFFFLFFNGIQDLLEKSIENINIISQNLKNQESFLYTEIILLISLFQILIFCYFIFLYIPQLKSISKYYKAAFKKIFSIEPEILLEISQDCSDRISKVHQKKCKIANTIRNRRPVIKNYWINLGIFICIVLGIYLILFNSLFTAQIVNTRQKYLLLTGKEELFLSIYAYNSFIWMREFQLNNFEQVNFAEILTNYLPSPDFKGKSIFYADLMNNSTVSLEKEHNFLHEFDFFYNFSCKVSNFCDARFYNGLGGALNEYVFNIRYNLEIGMNEKELKFIENYTKIIVDSLDYLKTMNHQYLDSVLSNILMVQNSLIIGFLMAVLLLSFQLCFLKPLLQRTIMISNVNKFFKVKNKRSEKNR